MTSVASAAQIDTAAYLGDAKLNYPVIITDDADVNAKITSVIRAEVERFVGLVEETAGKNNAAIGDISVDFEIPCNHTGGILSVVLTEFVYFENAAHPSTFKRGLNFNSDTGERITADSLSEIGGVENGEPAYSPKNITRKLSAYAEKNNLQLFDDLKNLENLPEDFYFDDDLHVHILFQQYEVAPYAVGIIDLDATAN